MQRSILAENVFQSGCSFLVGVVFLLCSASSSAQLEGEEFSNDPIVATRFNQVMNGTESKFTFNAALQNLSALLDVDQSPAYYLSNPFTPITDAVDSSFSVEFRVDAVDDQFTPTGFIGLVTTNHVEDFGDGLTMLLSTDNGRLNVRGNIDASDFRAAGSTIPIELLRNYLAIGRYKSASRLLTLEVFDGLGFTNLVGFSTAALPVGRSLRVDRIGLQNGGAEDFDRDVGSIKVTVDNLFTPADKPNSISIDDTSVVEGSAGTKEAVFIVRLSPASSQPVSVNFITADGSATAGTDYTLTSGTMTFPPLTTTARIVVPILDDKLDEPDEAFFVRLSNSVDAAIERSEATATIQDDDPSPSITINDVVVAEGDPGVSTEAVFFVNLSAPSARPISVPFSTANGTALSPDDFLSNSGRLDFGPGETIGNIKVVVVGDAALETNETFLINLGLPTNATVAKSQGVGTIIDAGRVVISVNDSAVREGDSGTAQISFDVTLNRPASSEVSVHFGTISDSATVGIDLLARSGDLVFPKGLTRTNIAVTVLGDRLPEADERFFLSLSNPINADLAVSRGTGTITNDDPFPHLLISDVTVREGNSGTTNAVVPVILTFPIPEPVTVHYQVNNGTAKLGSDFGLPSSGTLTFEAGTTNVTITIPVIGDMLDEDDEAFQVELSAPVNAVIGKDRALVTILDDDEPPRISINDITIPEPDSGMTEAVFTVSLSAPSGREVRVSYSTADGTALAGSDYVAGFNTLTFSPGATQQSVRVGVQGETMFEDDEFFYVNLGSPANAVLLNGQGKATIVNNDARPSILINSVTVTERSEGTNAIFTVNLSNPTQEAVTFDFSTSNGTAQRDADYLGVSGSVTISPGAISQTISIRVLDDLLDEDDETFFVNLTNVLHAVTNLPQSQLQGRGVISDNEIPLITVDDVAIHEGDTGTTNAIFTLKLSIPSTRTISLAYQTLDGTARLDEDYRAGSGTIVFPPGSVSSSISITILGDIKVEPDETLLLNLGSAINAQLARTTATATIRDDDSREISINDVAVLEGGLGTTTDANFILSLSKPSSNTVVVSYATANGSASAGNSQAQGDYQATSGTITFAPGETRKTVSVQVFGDDLTEPDEDFYVDLSNPVNGSLTRLRGRGVVLNDDIPEPVFIIYPVGTAIAVENCRPANQAIDPYETVTVNFALGNRGNIPTPSITATLVATNGISPGGGVQTQAYGVLTPKGPSVAKPFTFTVAGRCGETVSAILRLRSGNDDLGEVSFDLHLGINPAGTLVCCSQADVAVSAVDQPDPVQLGETITYHIVVTNRGPASAAGVALNVRLDAGLRFLSVEGNNNSWTNQDDLLTTRIGDLEPGAAEQITMVVQTETPGRLISRFVLTSPSDDPDLNNNFAVSDTDVRAPIGISIYDAAPVKEGDQGVTNAVFTVRLNPPSGRTTTVDFLTVAGSALEGADYDRRSGTITFPPGVTIANVSLAVRGDTLDEVDEVFEVVLSNPQNAPIAPGYDRATGTIVDDDEPCLTISDLRVTEPVSGESVEALVLVSLTSPSDRIVRAEFQTESRTAVGGSDYKQTSGTIEFPPGRTNAVAAISILGDSEGEKDETFVVQLVRPVGAIICLAQATMTIHEEPLPVLTIADTSLLEGDSGLKSAEFQVKLSAPSTRAVQLDFTTTDGTARANQDYLTNAGSLTIAPGTTQATIRVSVVGDSLPENDETFFVELSHVRQASLTGRSRSAGTITNDDYGPKIASAGAALLKENCPPPNAAIDPLETVTVNFSLKNEGFGSTANLIASLQGSDGVIPLDEPQNYGVLTAGGPSVSRPFTFAVDHQCGEAFAATLELRDDLRALPPIRFVFTTGVDSAGRMVCCQSADLGVSLSHRPESIEVGDPLTYSITVTNRGPSWATEVFLTNQLDGSLEFQLARLSGGSVLSDGNRVVCRLDDLPPRGSALVEIVAGTFRVGRAISFSIVAGHERDTNRLDNTDADFVDILPPIGLFIHDTNTLEGTVANVTVSVYPPSARTVFVTVSLKDGTARSDTGDYTSVPNQRIAIPPGTTEVTVPVVIRDDELDEPEETFSLVLSEPSGAVIARGEAIVTIEDNDPPCLSINDVEVNVGLTGQAEAILTLSLSSSSERIVSVDFATADGITAEGVPATAGTDYVPRAGRIEFQPGTTQTNLVLTISGNTFDEGIEHFFVNLSRPTNASLCDPLSKITITDESPGTVTIADASIQEGDLGFVEAVFLLRLSKEQRYSVTLDYVTADRTALAGSDYAATNGTVVFLPGVTETNVVVRVVGDSMWEPDESFFLELSHARNASLARTQAIGMIVNDDAIPRVQIADLAVQEGDSGLTDALFTIRLSHPSSEPISISAITQAQTAQPGGDYVESSGTVSFPPGQLVAEFAVPIRGDELDEPDETFLLQLFDPTPPIISMPARPALGTIGDDDLPPSISIGNASVKEGDMGTTNAVFVVSLSGPSGQTFTVDYSTAEGTATAGIDFESLRGKIAFASGETRKTISVPVVGDTLYESDETFSVTLTNPSLAAIGNGQGLGTIINDDSTGSIPNIPPRVRIIRPLDHTIFRLGEEFAIEAEAHDDDPGGSIRQVEFFAVAIESGATLSIGIVTQDPYRVSWAGPDTGQYLLTARATDNQGAVGDSEPVGIVVSQACGRAAILGTLADLEIANVREYLYQLGVTSQIFDVTTASLEQLRDFELIIWDDSGSLQPTDREVDLLTSLSSPELGKALYFIVQQAGVSPPSLSPQRREQWTRLLHLRAQPAPRNASAVLIDYGPVHPVVSRGVSGDVENFAISLENSGTEQTGDSRETVLGRALDSDVLVAFENVLIGGSGRIVTQAFPVSLGSDEASKAQRRRLFQNAVWWLMKCGCSNLDVALEVQDGDKTIAPGSNFDSTVVVRHSGGCEAISVTVTATLPEGVDFLGATAERSLWFRNGNVVTFAVGRMTRGASEELRLLLQPVVASGLLTNTWTVQSLNEVGGGLKNNLLLDRTQVGTARSLLLAIATGADGRLRLLVTQPATGRLIVEFSENLADWIELNGDPLSEGGSLLIEPIQGKSRFYRARLE